uniref:Voltage-dependent T-type calcium channel subunit alpha-1H n=1 Tax=Gopherus evgoodei TaxID=1825980 RepID=A0A8C4WP32_9SAUR
MTDGERREPFQPLASDEVRVPIASLPSQAVQPGEDEDALSPCKSIQGSLGSGGSSARDPAQDDEEQVPYPALAPTVFFCLKQTTRPRSWCLRLVCNPYPFPGEAGSAVWFVSLDGSGSTLGVTQLSPCSQG